MKRSVRFLPEALGDLLETRHWYASRERGGADRARSGLISTCARESTTARGAAVPLCRLFPGGGR